MLAPAPDPECQQHQRVNGQSRVEVSFDGKETRLTGLRQAGSAKCLLPKIHNPIPEAVFLNTAGGLTGGDQFEQTAIVNDGAQLVATSQTAERIYKSPSVETAVVRNNISVGEHSSCAWLPQETILFDGGRLDRTLSVHLQQTSAFWAVESFVLGRRAMGETVRDGAVKDRWRVHRDGELIYADTLNLSDHLGPIADQMQSKATLDSSLAFATVLFVSPDAEDHIERARSHIAAIKERTAITCNIAVSAWRGMLTARLVAKDCFALREALKSYLIAMRQQSLPRVWNL